jgi:hypothetical protein
LLSKRDFSLAGINEVMVLSSHAFTKYVIVLYILLASPDTTAVLLNDHDPNGKVRLYCDKACINIFF